jgi:recombinational DNA repair protein RecR
MLFILRRNTFGEIENAACGETKNVTFCMQCFHLRRRTVNVFFVTCDICKLKETSSAALMSVVNKDRILATLHRTVARGLPFLAVIVTLFGITQNGGAI